MNLQTQLMRHGAEKFYEATQHKDGWSAAEYVNHPTPSGSARILPTVTDNRRWPTKEAAIEELKKLLVEIDRLFAEKFPDIFGPKAAAV